MPERDFAQLEQPSASSILSTLEETADRSSHIVGPALAQDAQALEQYLASRKATGALSLRPNPYYIYSKDPTKPVLFMSVQRQCVGLSRPKVPGFEQREIIEKLLGDFTTEIITLYFEHVHPCFPIIDAVKFCHDYQDEREKISPALLCDIYAITVPFWNRSLALASHPRPDVRYIWILAVHALNENFLVPGLTTILAAVLDLGGRPVTSITGNAVTTGRTVALARSLGLNRDPGAWSLGASETYLRIRVWWSVLIHDWWLSLSHGTPPNVGRNHYDVPVPTAQNLVYMRSTPNEIDAGQSFLYLCGLTEILGGALEQVFDLSPPNQQTSLKHLRRLEVDLGNWQECLINGCATKGGKLVVPTPGLQSLTLSFLSVKLLLCRLRLNITTHQSPNHHEAEPDTHWIHCLEAAENIVDFTESLSTMDLQGYWLSYTAYHFTSACTLLLRCALEWKERHLPRARQCLSSAARLMESLRQYKEKEEWDLGDICLTQCEAVVQRIGESFATNDRRNDMVEVMDIDLGDSMTIDALFPDLWDMFRFDGSGTL